MGNDRFIGVRVQDGGRRGRMIVAVVAVAAAVAGTAAASTGSNLIPNASFESGGSYSFTGWGLNSATQSAASDGQSGSFAARVTVSSGSSYGIYVKPQPVLSAAAGVQFQGSAWVRSDTPGRTVCLNVKEVGSAAQTQKSCVVTQSSWQQLPAVTLTVQTGGDAIGFVVNQPSGAQKGDSFEVDSVSLIQLGSGGGTDTTPPSTPGSFASPSHTTSSISLSWTAASDPDNDPSTLSYQISRNGTLIATTAAGVTSYTDSGLAAGSSYSYSIVAVDPVGNQSLTPAALTASTSPDTTPPSTPGNFASPSQTANSISLSWTAASDPDNDPSTLSYEISRNGTPITTTAAGATAYTDSGLASGTTYSYSIVAVDPAGNQSITPAGLTASTSPSGSGVVVGLWHLDETSGTTAFDSSGFGNEGTISGGVTLGAPGEVGTAYAFTNGAVLVPDNPGLRPGTANITVSYWTKMTVAPSSGDYDVFVKGDYLSSGGQIKLEIQQNGQASCMFRGSLGAKQIQYGPDIVDGNWHNVICQRIGNQIIETVDGTTWTYTQATGNISCTDPIRLGSHEYVGQGYTGGADWYKGSLDEVTYSIG